VLVTNHKSSQRRKWEICWVRAI